MSACAICTAEDLDEIERAGADVLNGNGSWLALGEQFGLNRQSLKNHMEKHWVAPASPTEQALSEFDTVIASTIERLLDEMKVASPTVAPFYAIAIKNLKELDQTKPSQQNLTNALRAIVEVTGMKQDQVLMLEFARARFGLGATQAVPMLERLNVIDVEVVEGD